MDAIYSGLVWIPLIYFMSSYFSIGIDYAFYQSFTAVIISLWLLIAFCTYVVIECIHLSMHKSMWHMPGIAALTVAFVVHAHIMCFQYKGMSLPWEIYVLIYMFFCMLMYACNSMNKFVLFTPPPCLQPHLKSQIFPLYIFLMLLPSSACSPQEKTHLKQAI